jgi:hypothetical protein
MRVLVQRTAQSGIDSFDVWFVEDDQIASVRRVASFEAQKNAPARLTWQVVEEGARIDATLRMSGYEVEQLRRGLDEYGPTTTDNLTFLKDAVKVRDRLLTLVETLTTNDA